MHLLWSASFFHCSRSLQFIIYSAPAATSLAGVASCVLITTHTHTHNHELGHFWHMYTGCGARGQRRLLWDSALRTLARSLPRQRRVECVGTKIPPACDIVFPIGWWQTSGTSFCFQCAPLMAGCGPISHALMAAATFGRLATCATLKAGRACRGAEPVKCL